MKTKLLLSFILLLLAASSLLGQTYGQRMVAAVIVAEAGIEGYDGMVAVAEVIRNRADNNGTSMLAEVQRKGQFTSVVQGGGVEAIYWKFHKTSYYKDAIQIARLAYNTPEKLPGMTKGANFFALTTSRPSWAKGKKPVAIIGRHSFYRL